jgi:hypothetical protein
MSLFISSYDIIPYASFNDYSSLELIGKFIEKRKSFAKEFADFWVIVKNTEIITTFHPFFVFEFE